MTRCDNVTNVPAKRKHLDTAMVRMTMMMMHKVGKGPKHDKLVREIFFARAQDTDE